MSGGDKNNRDNAGKVTPLEAHRANLKDRAANIEADNLDELLARMRRVRETIPVNNRLREELKARILAARAGAGGGTGLATGAAGTEAGPLALAPGGRGKTVRLLWLLPALLLLGLAWLGWFMAAPRALEAGPVREISRFWQEETPLEFASLPENRGFLAVRNGALLLLDQQGSQVGSVKPGQGERYASPALTRDGGRLALMRRHDHGSSDIISLDLPGVELQAGVTRQVETALAGARILASFGQGVTVSGLAWSPDRKSLAYVLSRPGGENEVFLLTGSESMPLGPGRYPAWSPDGSRLAVERAGESGEPEIWLVEPGSGSSRLTAGEQPAWGPRGHLAYIRTSTTERVLTYSPDGSPLFSVRQRQGEIRSVNLNKPDRNPAESEGILRGGKLLLAPDPRPGVDELNWLRQLEFAGVREPRTLLVDQAGSYQGMSFAADGNSLLVARRDGSMVSLQQVSLRERISRRGDK